MRAAWIFTILLPSTLVGCVAKPIPPVDKVPVIVIDSEFTRYEPDGSEWAPPFPGFHGCGDSFEVVTAEERVRLNERVWQDQDLDAPRAFVSVLVRDPAAYYRNHEAFMPETLPFEHPLVMGNVRPFNGTLLVTGDEITFGKASLPVAKSQEYRFDYEWRRDDGVVLNVTERITIQYLGQWEDPLEASRFPGCE